MNADVSSAPRHLKSAALAQRTLEVLEVDADIGVVFLAQEQVPQSEPPRLRLECLDYGRVALPPLRRVGRDLVVERRLGGEAVLLDELDELGERLEGERAELVRYKSPRAGRNALGSAARVGDRGGGEGGSRGRDELGNGVLGHSGAVLG